jgi:hypothetical protein
MFKIEAGAAWYQIMPLSKRLEGILVTARYGERIGM